MFLCTEPFYPNVHIVTPMYTIYTIYTMYTHKSGRALDIEHPYFTTNGTLM